MTPRSLRAARRRGAAAAILLALACAGPAAAAEPRIDLSGVDRAIASLEAATTLAVAASVEARDAIAEARFLQAEERRRAAERITLPPYKGANDSKAILAYLETTARPWADRRRAAIDAAERAYLRVFGVEPPPKPPPPPPPPPGFISLGGDPNTGIWSSPLLDPFSIDWKGEAPSPRWAIAAAARVGSLHADLGEAIRALPSPPRSWSEIRVTYYSFTQGDALDDIVFKQRAKAVFEAGLRLAIRHRIFDESAEACELWLSKHYGFLHHALVELHAPPRWLSSGIVAQPAR